MDAIEAAKQEKVFLDEMSRSSDERVQAVLQAKRTRIKNQARKLIWVTFRREGIHKYPAAATDPKLATGDEYDVSFLAEPHRHIFHFKIAIQVFHDDRDIEFIQFKRWVENLFNKGTLQLDFKSCEMISDELYDQIAVKYPNRHIEVDVSEDGENGSTTTYSI
jgi:hypothetical protein